LAGFVRGSVPGINVVFRVGGTLDTLRLLLANGFPVVVEEGMYLQEAFWFEDDRWAGHYLLLTAYDDTAQAFTVQDSLEGADRSVRYTDLDANWQTFNRVFLVVYPSEAETQVSALLGADWNADVNRQRALETAQAETLSQPKNAFAWFNLGSNLVYFERYAEAAEAYDRAREIGLPQRMLRYQFGPFLAYFHAGRTEDLLAISDFAVKITPNAEEALLWNGWARYRMGDRNGALARFQEALKAYPGYADAQYALNFLSQN
jgi:tetratricopeptide (TPR) repeat protein